MKHFVTILCFFVFTVSLTAQAGSLDAATGTFQITNNSINQSLVEIDEDETGIDFVLEPPDSLSVDPYSGLFTWSAPSAGTAEWLHWDSGENYEAIGLSVAAPFSYAARWDAVMMAPYAGLSVTTISYYPRSHENATFTFKIWTGSNAATEVYSQDITHYTPDQWNEFTLDTPYILTGEEFWVGFEVIQYAGDHPAGCDAGPAIAGYGDMLSVDNGASWLPLSAYGWLYNWNLQVLVDSGRGESVSLGHFTPQTEEYPPAENTVLQSMGHLSMFDVNEKDEQPSRDITGYNVYLNGTLLGNTTDLEWQFTNLIHGTTYTAGVATVYDEGTSNTVEIDFMYEGTGVGNEMPHAAEIMTNYPNPFNPVTTILFSTMESSRNTELAIYNSRGQKINTLVNEKMPAGQYTAVWDGTDETGKPVSSGIYFYMLSSGKLQKTRKMILLK